MQKIIPNIAIINKTPQGIQIGLVKTSNTTNQGLIFST